MDKRNIRNLKKAWFDIFMAGCGVVRFASSKYGSTTCPHGAWGRTRSPNFRSPNFRSPSSRSPGSRSPGSRSPNSRSRVSEAEKSEGRPPKPRPPPLPKRFLYTLAADQQNRKVRWATPTAPNNARDHVLLAKWLVSLTSDREVPGTIPTGSRFFCAVTRGTGYSWPGMRVKCILYTVGYIILGRNQGVVKNCFLRLPGRNARLYFDVKLKYLYLYLYHGSGHYRSIMPAAGSRLIG